MDKIEEKILKIIDENRDRIISNGRDIWYHAEMGFKEYRTSRLFKDAMKDNPLTVDNLAITGVKSYLKPKKEGDINVCLIGELDALPIAANPDANPETGASHCCGHNAQIAGVIGASIALQDEEVKNALGGNVIFMAAPSEEFVDIEFKNGLINEGKIKYGGGKCELIAEGAFDDVDIVCGHHADPNCDMRISNGGTNGFVNKTVKFKGKAAHAASCPENGIDAMAACSVAMHALDANRETFKDEDAVRVHGFISNGGEAMNVIADTVTMEYSVRANNVDAFIDASNKFDRSFKAGAMAVGAGVEIVTLPGYLPFIPQENVDVLRESIELVAESYHGKYTRLGLDSHTPSITGSTDAGDVSQLKPYFQFKTGGYEGILHNANMHVTDEELAYVTNSKIFAIYAYKLLKNNAENAKKIIADFKPKYTKETYCEYMDSIRKVEDVSYSGN